MVPGCTLISWSSLRPRPMRPEKSTRPSASRASAARPAFEVGFGTPPASGRRHAEDEVGQRGLDVEVRAAALVVGDGDVVGRERQPHRRVALGEGDANACRAMAAATSGRRPTPRSTSPKTVAATDRSPTLPSCTCTLSSVARVVARAAGWLLLGALFAAAQLTLDPVVASVQEPRLLERGGRATRRRLVLAACAALAFAFAAALARQLVPDPWAWRAAAVPRSRPPGFELAGSTAAPPAALLTAGLLGALRTRDHPTRKRTLGGRGVPGGHPVVRPRLRAARAAASCWRSPTGRAGAAGACTRSWRSSSAARRRSRSAGVETSRATGAVHGIERVAELVAAAPVLLLGAVSIAARRPRSPRPAVGRDPGLARRRGRRRADGAGDRRDRGWPRSSSRSVPRRPSARPGP